MPFVGTVQRAKTARDCQEVQAGCFYARGEIHNFQSGTRRVIGLKSKTADNMAAVTNVFGNGLWIAWLHAGSFAWGGATRGSRQEVVEFHASEHYLVLCLSIENLGRIRWHWIRRGHATTTIRQCSGSRTDE